ncbi:hypothetical protein RvY_03531-2 [Ramazzottius varieornatus]|uniref:Uncharacterized protein n=1 Tax=Ramazzottius varieornatus TaxID=947166 RepID=A0A1D1URS2_RAMVA|nr:hypothetical protein RvY_03531-2 [Ramazzottius varieornatus]
MSLFVLVFLPEFWEIAAVLPVSFTLPGPWMGLTGKLDECHKVFNAKPRPELVPENITCSKILGGSKSPSQGYRRRASVHQDGSTASVSKEFSDNIADGS